MTQREWTVWLPSALMLLWLPGCSTMRGPSAVTGREGGSLTVKCDYDPGYEKYVKWWCRGAAWGPCRILVKTTGSEQEVKNDRISIKDCQEDRTFTVIMELLRKDDADVYWCGIEKTGTDLGAKVKVSVDPAPVSSSESSTRTLGPPTSLPACTRTSRTSQETSDPRPHSRSLLSSVHFLLLVFLKVPLLLSMLVAVLWVNRPQRAPGRRLSHPNVENQ